MNRRFLILAIAATMLGACSYEIDSVVGTPEIGHDNTEVSAQTPVLFDAYTGRALTRAGAEGTLDNTALQSNGFGVFGYYTENEFYNDTYQPTFMYNAKVSGDNWTYSPLKYWPNEFGSAAESEDVDRLSFFAYAPYVQVNPSTGIPVNEDATTGIIAMTRNSSTGDPFVKYAVNFDPAHQVDFSWGVAKTGAPTGVTGEQATVAAGSPFKDLVKPAADQKIGFEFNHALAQLNVQLDAKVDGADNVDINNTRIWVRSVTFEGFATKGSFNLNQSKEGAVWTDLAGNSISGSDEVTVYDGRTDGNEGVSAATNETPAALNKGIVQAGAYTVDADNNITTPTATGVTKAPQNLFNSSSDDAPLYVIPNQQDFKVTIVYDVETVDNRLSKYLADGVTKGSRVKNTIKQVVKFGDATQLEAGKKYVLKLHLGMSTVKFDASVAKWGAANETEGSLPLSAIYTISQLKAELSNFFAQGKDPSALQKFFTGWFVHPDGTINTTSEGATGKIAYLSPTDEDVDTGIPGSRILVMGLTDAYHPNEDGEVSQEFHFINNNDLHLSYWNGHNHSAYSNSELGFGEDIDIFKTLTSQHEEFKTIGTASGNRSGKRNGYAITAAAVNHSDYSASFFAYQAAWQYKTSEEDTTGSEYGLEGETGAAGHWFLPTVEQMILMGAPVYRFISNDESGKSEINLPYKYPLQDLSRTSDYWLSSEYTNNNAWTYKVQYVAFGNDQKFAEVIEKYHHRVRPVFAY